MYVCMCMYVCMYICMYVCMYLCICVYYLFHNHKSQLKKVHIKLKYKYNLVKMQMETMGVLKTTY